MTARKLHPQHTHDWQPALTGTLAVCSVCELSMPKALVHLDQPDTLGRPLNPPEPKEPPK